MINPKYSYSNQLHRVFLAMAKIITSLSDSRQKRQDHCRISELPDSILGHILSFLPTEDAVATGVLSKRWKLLWTSTVNLDFYCPEDCNPALVEQFVQFVNCVFLRHKPGGCFNELYLTWKKGCIPVYVNAWIAAALDRDVLKLKVCVGISILPNQVQSYLFSSEKLQSLELKCSICISPDISVSLPSLERLKLVSICFQSEESFSNLLQGCPILKYLVIHMDVGKMIENYHLSSFKCIISSLSLRHFELYAYDKFSGHDWTILCDVQLDAPSLRYIKLKHQIRNVLEQQRPLNLDEAIIQFNDFDYGTGYLDYCNGLVEAFRVFGCAKTLTLSEYVIHALSCATTIMQTEFKRLKRFEVTVDFEHWPSLHRFLELSDNLEVLKIDMNHEDVDEFDFSDAWMKPYAVPRCFSNSLKTVSIDAYGGYPEEFKMVDYILTHGSVLEAVQISFDESITEYKRMFELVRQISESPRKSPICKVKFHDCETVIV